MRIKFEQLSACWDGSWDDASAGAGAGVHEQGWNLAGDNVGWVAVKEE